MFAKYNSERRGVKPLSTCQSESTCLTSVLLSRLLSRLTASEGRVLIESGALGSGSMGPKVEAAAHFVEGGGERAIIAALHDGPAGLAGTSGTTVTPDRVPSGGFE